MNAELLIEKLNAEKEGERLLALAELVEMTRKGDLPAPVRGTDVNNHIHTYYSFSPYSPTKAVWMAWQAGLATAGIMDHDSLAGAKEFIRAGEIAGMATTVGVECRADMSGTRLHGRRINNPDQQSVAYVAIHGVPHQNIDMLQTFFSRLRDHRNLRNRKMTAAINHLLAAASVSIDFDQDVLPLSHASEGGSVTERHLLYAVSLKLIGRLGKGPALTTFLKSELKLSVSDKISALLEDAANPHYAYDLLGVLKSDMVEKFYIPATEECPDIREVVRIAEQAGAVLAYAYLGDVGNSVTGDKKTQTFEDSYLDELFEEIHALGFRAVTYMPSRNEKSQLMRLRALCRQYGFFQISGEDINTPRQKFICEALRDPDFSNLTDAAWALIGHERAATECLSEGFFSEATLEKYPELEVRIAHFSAQAQA